MRTPVTTSSTTTSFWLSPRNLTMRFFIVMVLILVGPLLLLAQPSGSDSIKVLIKKLGSANFAEREVATEALKTRPEAAPLLRDALRLPDRETSSRAARILEHFGRRPVHELIAAVKTGQVECAIES